MRNIKVTLNNPDTPVDKLKPIDDTFMQKLGEDRKLFLCADSVARKRSRF